MVFEQRIHDDVRPGPAVEDIADQMQAVNGHGLDYFTDCGDEIGRLSDFDNRGNDVLVIIQLVDLVGMGVQQFFNDIRVFGRERCAHLGTRIPGTDRPADLNQPVEGDAVPFVQVRNLRFQLFQLLLGIVNQRCQFIQIRVRDAVVKKQVKLLAHYAGAGVQDVKECLMLSVDIRDKMFAAFRKIQDRFQIDDFRSGCAQGRVLPREHAEKTEFLGRIGFVGRHRDPSLFSQRA